MIDYNTRQMTDNWVAYIFYIL